MLPVVNGQSSYYFPILLQVGRAFNVADGNKFIQELCIHNKVTVTKRALRTQGHITSRRNCCFRLCFNRKFSTTSKAFSAKVNYKKNYYQILGVTPKCTDARIKQAYYRLSKIYHPDVNKSKEAVEKFHEITEAYEILSNSTLRHTYDTGRHGHTRGVQRGVKPHPVNFNARGPHQYRPTVQYNQAEWLKNHYSDAFRRTKERKDDLDFVKELKPPKLKKPVNIEHKSKFFSLKANLLYLTISLLVSCIALQLYKSQRKR